MEDHHNNHHHPQQYGMADLRQLMNGGPRSTATHFSSLPPQPTAELFQAHRNLTPTHHQHYDMMMFGRHVADVMPRALHDFASDSPPAAAPPTNNITVATPATTASAFTPPLSGLEAETPGCLAGDASTGRWPRQETLTLLEIRSRLDPKFKEANQKGPLWDEVSRIMSEEYGYQRSGKKCREKFENLYKYYKKTKEGKARRQDGKHYRFFRQLEALYGGNSNSTSVQETNYGSSGIRFQTPSQTNQDMFQSHNHKTCDSLSLTNSTDFGTSSSEDNNLCSMENDSTEKGRKRSSGSRWKAKIKEFIDSQMKKLIEKQEAWMDRLVKTLEQKEKERISREEEWRRQEAARLEMEHKFRAKERAWIEARDAALMDALQKLTGREVKAQSPVEQALIVANEIQNPRENQNEEGSEILNGSNRGVDNWPKSETTRLLELRAEMESGFQQSGCSEEVMWEEIANKMACFGYERTALMCKHKWESINSFTNTKEGIKKRKEKSRSCFYFDNNVNDQPSLYNQGTTPYCDIDVNDQRHDNERLQTNNGSSPSNSNAVAADVNCFPFFISTEGSENLWENYGLKINKGNQNQ
ncbi:trihelix transcription factor PTL-like isoform X2 [Neltuma alba]|nr:trihelix transcription factor PTL-like isoform X2 [Prosopis alba]